MRRVAEILATGRPTLFRWESACRHGLRAGLCLKGWRWEAADEQAAKIVSLALHRIGAGLRPTWRVGQPEAIEREYRWCSSCGGYMEGGSDRPWCGEECRRARYNGAYHSSGRWDDAIRRDAVGVILTGGAAAVPAIDRACRRCGERFTPSRRIRGRPQWFCSQACGLRADRHIEPRPCGACGEVFRPPRQARAMYCSVTCRDVAYGARKARERAAALAA